MRPTKWHDIARSLAPTDARDTAPSSSNDMPCAGIRRSQISNHCPDRLFMGTRMRWARHAEPAHVDDSVGSASVGSLGNYLSPGRSVGDLLSPEQEQTDVSRHPAGKIQEPSAHWKTLRFQVALPSQIEFCCLATQGIRPAHLRYVDGSGAIAAELAREAHQHEFLFSLL